MFINFMGKVEDKRKAVGLKNPIANFLNQKQLYSYAAIAGRVFM